MPGRYLRPPLAPDPIDLPTDAAQDLLGLQGDLLLPVRRHGDLFGALAAQHRGLLDAAAVSGG